MQCYEVGTSMVRGSELLGKKLDQTRLRCRPGAAKTPMTPGGGLSDQEGTNSSVQFSKLRGALSTQYLTQTASLPFVSFLRWIRLGRPVGGDSLITAPYDATGCAIRVIRPGCIGTVHFRTSHSIL